MESENFKEAKRIIQNRINSHKMFTITEIILETSSKFTLSKRYFIEGYLSALVDEGILETSVGRTTVYLARKVK